MGPGAAQCAAGAVPRHELQLQAVDLLIWPETAVPVLKESAEGYLNMMGNFAAERHRR
jgi:apolipoprotein N-acyltransferase